MFEFPYPVPDPADLPPPSTAQQFFATIAMLLLLSSLVLWLLPAPFSRRILRIILSGVWPFHRSGSLDSSASGASSVNAATDTAKLRLLCAMCGKTMREPEPGSKNGSNAGPSE